MGENTKARHEVIVPSAHKGSIKLSLPDVPHALRTLPLQQIGNLGLPQSCAEASEPLSQVGGIGRKAFSIA